MKNINIGTWNVKNSYFLVKENSAKVDAIIDLLYKEELDVFGLQEVNPTLVSELSSELKKMRSSYNITLQCGKTRNPIKNVTSECNLFVSKLPYLEGQIIELPSFPTKVETYGDIFNIIRDTGVTKQDFIVYDDSIRFFNTRLSDRDDVLNREQFDVIYGNLARSTYVDQLDNILMGNLNIKPNSYNMDYYRTMLASIGMKIVDNNYRTYKGNEEQVVDYVVVPNNYQVSQILCVDSYDEKVSTHNPLIVKLKK